MRNKKGIVTVQIVCFLSFISVVSLLILKTEISKTKFVDFYKKESFIEEDVRELAQRYLYKFKTEKLDLLEQLDDEKIRKQEYSHYDSGSKISYDEEAQAFKVTVHIDYQFNYYEYYKYKIIEDKGMKNIIFSELK